MPQQCQSQPATRNAAKSSTALILAAMALCGALAAAHVVLLPDSIATGADATRTAWIGD